MIRGVRRSAAALGAVALLASAPLPHPGPPVYVECEIGESEVVVRFTGEQHTLCHWLGFADEELPLAAPLSDAEVERVTAAVRERIVAPGTFTIDDAAPEPMVGEVGVPADEVTGYGEPALTFSLRVRVAETPRRMGIAWHTWERLTWFEQVKLPVLFRSFADATLAFLTPEEPGFVWHAESIVPREPTEVLPVEAPPPRTMHLPLCSGLIVLLTAGAAFVARRRGLRALPLAAIVVSGASAAVLARGFWTVEVDDPFRADVEVPAPESAKELFERLHRNVYAAFSARSEDEVYTLLAATVRPGLLDELYGDIYESLILRGEGGAVCEIERIEVLDGEVEAEPVIEPWEFVYLPPGDPPYFRVEWEWNVHGVVSHWGHEHRRLNHYRATYTVAHDGTSWKIAGMDVLDHSHVDSDG